MYQKITLIGNLGADPEMRYTPGGKAVTNFSMATNRHWTDGDGQKQQMTTWFRISVWGSQAEAVNTYLSQGSRVAVEGRMNPDPETGGPKVWQRKDGSWGASYEVTAQRVVFISTKEENEALRGESSMPKANQNLDEDDIPF